MVKILDKLVLKGFIAPYIAAFMIAEFVLVMQFLWKYIDEIIGKGISIGVLFELIFYFAVTIIPLAIPITILISSVMVFGNLSERHELSSFKSAGVSLFRVMAAGIVVAILTALFSFFASNYLKPKANYQYLYRFNSIRKQKPSLSIEKGVFNYDFKDFVIRIGDRDENGNGISDILIYDHSGVSSNLINVVIAEKGEMYSSEDGSYFVMKLYEGHQYHEESSKLNKETKKRSYPMTRTDFKEWVKIFDMSQFELGALNINLDRKKYDLMNSWQLKKEIDTFEQRKVDVLALDHFNFRNLVDDMTILKQEVKEVKGGPLVNEIGETESKEDIKSKVELAKTKKLYDEKVEKFKNREKFRASRKVKQDTVAPFHRDSAAALYQYFPKTLDHKKFLQSAHINAVREKDNYFSKVQEVKSLQAYKNIYQLRRHQQFSWAMVCILFLFIGAPLGSIIRKGGYGYPLLIAIIFFMIFVILNILGEKMNKSQFLPPILSAWLPALFLLPFAVVITYKAIRDDRFENNWMNIFRRKEKVVIDSGPVDSII